MPRPKRFSLTLQSRGNGGKFVKEAKGQGQHPFQDRYAPNSLRLHGGNRRPKRQRCVRAQIDRRCGLCRHAQRGQIHADLRPCAHRSEDRAIPIYHTSSQPWHCGVRRLFSYTDCRYSRHYQDAHANRGLGLSFLRHIERTEALVYCLELAPYQERDPFEEFLMLRRELESYNPAMLEKPFLVALNKIDQEGSAELAAAFREKYPFDASTLFEISALEKIGLSPFLEALRALAQRNVICYG